MTRLGALLAVVSHSAPPTPAAARRWLRALAAPGRYRVIRDNEGWPLIPGRLGRIDLIDRLALVALPELLVGFRPGRVDVLIAVFHVTTSGGAAVRPPVDE